MLLEIIFWCEMARGELVDQYYIVCGGIDMPTIPRYSMHGMFENILPIKSPDQYEEHLGSVGAIAALVSPCHSPSSVR